MLEPSNNNELPPIPDKRYFTIGEVSVLRYWEQEFTELNPVKRRGNRRYYQCHEVLIIRQIKSLLYEQGYTIGGAKVLIMGSNSKEQSTRTKQIQQMLQMQLQDL